MSTPTFDYYLGKEWHVNGTAIRCENDGSIVPRDGIDTPEKKRALAVIMDRMLLSLAHDLATETK